MLSSAMHDSEVIADGSHTRQSGRNCYGDLEELEEDCTRISHSHNIHHVIGPAGIVGSVLGFPPNGSKQKI